MAIGAAVDATAEPINVRASLCARFARIHAAGTPKGWSMRSPSFDQLVLYLVAVHETSAGVKCSLC
jgi:hypothetical protein